MYKGIQNITAHDQQMVLAAMKRWKGNRANPDIVDIKMLFAKYHHYVYRSPADMACSSCVQFIFDYWTRQIALWTNPLPTENG